jgi:hypothetical protein
VDDLRIGYKGRTAWILHGDDDFRIIGDPGVDMAGKRKLKIQNSFSKQIWSGAQLYYDHRFSDLAANRDPVMDVTLAFNPDPAVQRLS